MQLLDQRIEVLDCECSKSCKVSRRDLIDLFLDVYLTGNKKVLSSILSIISKQELSLITIDSDILFFHSEATYKPIYKVSKKVQKHIKSSLW
jgi:hypothetical protein